MGEVRDVHAEPEFRDPVTELKPFVTTSEAQQMSPHDREIGDTLTQIVLAYERGRPRSLQRRIGPSEVGEPCVRKLAYKVSGFPEPPGAASDPWYAIIGTSVHAWLATAIEKQNELATAQGLPAPWLTEQSVQIRPNLTGSADLVHKESGTVIDHKIVGFTNHRKYRLHGPSQIYRTQIHLYGIGVWNMGIKVNKVAIAFFPRSDDLKGLHVFSEPFDPQIGIRALIRLDDIQLAVNALDPAAHPERFMQFPRTPSDDCRYCPWMLPTTDTGATCPGNLG